MDQPLSPPIMGVAGAGLRLQKPAGGYVTRDQGKGSRRCFRHQPLLAQAAENRSIPEMYRREIYDQW